MQTIRAFRSNFYTSDLIVECALKIIMLPLWIKLLQASNSTNFTFIKPRIENAGKFLNVFRLSDISFFLFPFVFFYRLGYER